ncbi:hypothetical protein Cadr_000002521 [Camelus dromedarius]|uniref:Uncharacterized protein n=1 Tax=Camelus dromedarius TaxID=9838 RepID=A0A5N4C1L4_CAMDR|nr:hypothetical protein Cadr_000002521 [Camelus dromedarius]
MGLGQAETSEALGPHTYPDGQYSRAALGGPAYGPEGLPLQEIRRALSCSKFDLAAPKLGLHQTLRNFGVP